MCLSKHLTHKGSWWTLSHNIMHSWWSPGAHRYEYYLVPLSRSLARCTENSNLSEVGWVMDIFLWRMEMWEDCRGGTWPALGHRHCGAKKDSNSRLCWLEPWSMKGQWLLRVSEAWELEDTEHAWLPLKQSPPTCFCYSRDLFMWFLRQNIHFLLASILHSIFIYFQ